MKIRTPLEVKTIWLTAFICIPKRQCISKAVLGVTEETNSVEVNKVGAAKWRVVLPYSQKQLSN